MGGTEVKKEEPKSQQLNRKESPLAGVDVEEILKEAELKRKQAREAKRPSQEGWALRAIKHHK